MSNLKAKNIKLHERALRILIAETGLDQDAAASVFEASGSNLSVALVMTKANCSREQADEALRVSNGKVEDAVKLLKS